MKLIEVSGVEFDAFATKHELNNLQQNSTWGKIERYNGWEDHYILFKTGAEIVGGCIILKKKFLKYTKMYSPRGILIDYNNKEHLKECIELLKKYGRENNAIFIKLEPYLIYQELDKNGNIVENGDNNFEIFKYLTKTLKLKHHGFSPNKFYSNSRYIATLNLDKDITEIEADYTAKCKSSIKKAIENSIDIHYFNKEELSDFYNCLEDSADHHSFYNPSIEYFRDLYDILDESQTGWFVGCQMDVKKNRENLEQLITEVNEKISKLRPNDKKIKEFINEKNAFEKRLDLIKDIKEDKITLCGAIFIEVGDTYYYYISGAKRNYLSFCAPYFLQREMIRKAKEKKLKTYNFLGISGIFDPKHPRYGVIFFKKGFNANMIELMGEFDIVINKFGYYLNIIINKLKELRNKLK